VRIDWENQRYALHEPASRDAVNSLRAYAPNVSAEYFEFLERSNGGEGFLGISPGYFMLWRAEEVATFSAEYEISEYLPEYIAVGSSGGGDLFVLPISGRSEGIFMVPAIGMELEYVRLVAKNISTFEEAFGGEWQ